MPPDDEGEPMARSRADQPEGLETATDVTAETAETASSARVAPEDAPAAEDTTADDDTDGPSAPRYRVVSGSVSYPDDSGAEKRASEGDEIDDISDDDAAWLVADGILERI